jgi:hypothetical protein
VSRCADIIDAGSVGTMSQTLATRLASDEGRVSREAVREFYVGDLGPGESTERFLAAVDEALATRDRLVDSLT